MKIVDLVGIEDFDPVSRTSDFEYLQDWVKCHYPEIQIDCTRYLDGDFVVRARSLLSVAGKSATVEDAYCKALITFLENYKC